MNRSPWTDSEDDDLGAFQLIARDVAGAILAALFAALFIFLPHAWQVL